MHNHRKFDAFRGGAALVVALSHVCQIYFGRLIGWEHPAWIVARTLGWHAVIVFFLLSGYLITLSILKNSESADGFSGREFVAARIARIYPPFLASLLVVAVCMLALHALHLPGANSPFGPPSDVYALPAMTAAQREILTSLAMIQGMTSANPPFWSLYLEVWAYVIAFFFALGFFGRQRGTRIAGLAVGIATLAAASIGKNNFAFFFGIWALGAVICVLTHSGNRYRGAVITAAGYVGCIVVATLALTNIRMVGAAFPVRSIELIGGAAFAGIYSCLIFGLRALDRPYPQWLVNTGAFSYTLYVVHFPILALGLPCTLPWIGTSLLRTAVCSIAVFALDVALARALAKVVERPKYFMALIMQARLPLSRSEPRAAR